jgi:diguanylate cyclase (GGDEF)-like protein
MVAEVLAGGARRSGETIARYGGDEFAILLPRTDLERASALARHLCHGVHAMGLPHAHSTVAPHVTISVGVASVSVAHQLDAFAAEPTVLVEAADRALYDAKAAGRNCVIAHAVEADSKIDVRTLLASSAVTPSFAAKS